MQNQKKRFSSLLKETREKANQSTDVMAILLSMEKKDYQALEDGAQLPDNETLKRLCMMMEWNYYDLRRMISNEIAAPNPGGARPGEQGLGVPLAPSAMQALETLPLGGKIAKSHRFDSLGDRLREVRKKTGQEVQIIAMLLNIEPDHYRRLEAGAQPDNDLLKKISIIYDWNYYDIISLLRSEKAKVLQPWQVGSPFPGGSQLTSRLKTLLGEVEGLFVRIPQRDQEMILSQLELVRETIRRAQPAS